MTIPANQLPIKPKITPGWSVAGVILLLTGCAYALIGIKNRTVHTFLSTAYIVSLGVTVLIIYVMSVPVTQAAQGGYVAAAVLAGCALGTASIFFKEITEGLACALGGFCFSMWLLCLVPGGLLSTVQSKAIFIGCFTAVGFAFYFSHFTRDWALILTISFSGTTAVVLGIDCFSRAGLKEFWAYVWHLNDDIFPLGAETYPVTRGIRVEIAAIIILALVGVMSQIKLWRIVREKRTQRDLEKAQGQRDQHQEETTVGRHVEESNTRDRQEWERAHGNGEQDSSYGSSSSDDAKNGEKPRDSSNGAAPIEMADMSDSDREYPRIDPLTEKDQDGKMMVRVAADDVPEHSGHESDGEQEDNAASLVESNKPAGPGSKTPKPPTTSASEPPEVVPLPFSVPEEEEPIERSERSSVATFADDESKNGDVPLRHDSFRKRLSQGSARLLRNLSTRSSHHRGRSSIDQGESSEELIVPGGDRGDAASSVAATLDNDSIDESMHDSANGEESGGSRQDNELAANGSVGEEKRQEDKSAERSVDMDQKEEARSDALTTGDAAGDASQAAVPDKAQTSTTGGSAREPSHDDEGQEGQVSQKEPSEKPKSMSSGTSAPASLTKGHLPPSLSRVAMSYRTNEWAKHLGYADAPEPDELHVAEPENTTKTKSRKERPAPVDVQDLQRGAAEGVLPAAMPHSESRISLSSTNRDGVRRDSKTSASPTLSSPALAAPASPTKDREHALAALSGHPPPSPAMTRSSSSAALRRPSATFGPIAEEHYSPRYAPEAIPEEEQHVPGAMPASPQITAGAGDAPRRESVPGVVSYSNPQTLLGQREAFIRSKSQGNLLSHPGEYPTIRSMSQGNLLAQLPEYNAMMNRTPSEDGSLNNYPMYAAAMDADPDDVPLSQRREMMHRSSSVMSMSGNMHQRQPPMRRSSTGVGYTEETFNSHQPRRNSTAPSQAAREAKLAHFRSSVALDLRNGPPVVGSGRDTPYGSTTSLVGGRDDVQRNIQIQRSMLMGEKEAEAQRRESTLREKQIAERAFEERMRSGDLMEAHRRALRRMQEKANKE